MKTEKHGPAEKKQKLFKVSLPVTKIIGAWRNMKQRIVFWIFRP